MLHRRHLSGLLCLIALAVAGCQPSDRDRGSDLPVSFLQERIEAALTDVEAARAAGPGDPAEASDRLAASSLKLRQLNEYYLPLLAARQRVERALEYLGTEDTATRSAVDSAEAALLGIVRTHGRHLEGELRGSLEQLETIRTALAADDVEYASRVLEELSAHLESIFYRGDLVLHGSELESEN